MRRGLVFVLLCACGGEPDVPLIPVSSDAVATVDGVGISRLRLIATMDEQGLSRDDALESLISEALLVAEARRRGLTYDHREQRRVMADALAQAVEDSVRPADIAAEDVRVSFEAGRTHQERPESRQITLVSVVGADPATVNTAAEQIHERLRVAPAETLTQARAQPGRGAFTLGVQELNVLPDGTNLATAVFAVSCEPPCVMNDVLLSSGRAEVVRLESVTPAVVLSLEDAEPEVRRQLANALRAQRLIDLLDVSAVVRNEPAIARVATREFEFGETP